MAFALFGLLFNGPISHFFYQWVPLVSKNPLTILLIERTIYTPCYQAFALYTLARLEVKFLFILQTLKSIYARPRWIVFFFLFFQTHCSGISL